MKTPFTHRFPLYEGRVIRLVGETVNLENGVATGVEFIDHPGSTGIVAFLNESDIVLIRQYRYALKKHVWEIPAGTLDPDESPLQCATRELIEETGYRAGKWQKLGEILPAPGYSSESMHLYLTTDLHAAGQKLDADEIIDVETLSLDRVFEMIHRGTIQDGKTIAGLYLATSWLDRHHEAFFNDPGLEEM